MRRGTYLLALGSITEAIYLLAACRLPWWTFGDGSWNWVDVLGEGTGTLLAGLAAVLGLMTVYLLGWYLVRKDGGRRRIVWGFAVLFAATLFWLLPMTCDLFNYLTKAHLFTDLGANPLAEAPTDFQGPLILASPTSYDGLPSIYGPVWALLSGLATLGPHDAVAGIFYLKGLAAVAYLAAVWLLERILNQVRPGFAGEALYLFAWNPLVLLMAIGDGHNDIVMMAVVLLATWFLLRHRWALALGTLALSVWIKYVSLILFPIFSFYAWWQLEKEPARARWIVLGKAYLGFLLVTILVFAPFGDAAGIRRVVGRLLHPTNWQGGNDGLASAGFGLGLLMFCVGYAVLFIRLIRDRGSFQLLGNAGFTVFLLAFLFGAARSQPWHLIWPATLAGLADRRWAWPAVICLAGILLAVQLWVEWGMPGLGG